MRDSRLDNIRALMMLLVVFCHLIGAFSLGGEVYRAVYVFHMPVFIFLSGYFGKFTRRGFLNLLVLYIISQIVDFFFWKAQFPQWTADLTLRFYEPYMFQWYLVSLMSYMLITPLLDFPRLWQRMVCLAAAFAIAVFWGFDSKIGYGLSLGRTLTFLPFYVGGYYAGKWRKNGGEMPKWAKIAGICAGAAVAVYSVFWTVGHPLSYSFLYGAQSYSTYKLDGFTAASYRGLNLLFAAGWTALFMLATPNISLLVISRVGRNTLPVFLIHGYIVALVFKSELLAGLEAPVNYLAALAMAAVICAVLGNKWLNTLMRLGR